MSGKGKVKFHLGPLPVAQLVEWCPFCRERIRGGHHQGGTCTELCGREEAQPLARVKYCPLCGDPVSGPHACD